MESQEKLCSCCRRDLYEDCSILSVMDVESLDDPIYPEEWSTGSDGGLRCSEFEET